MLLSVSNEKHIFICSHPQYLVGLVPLYNVQWNLDLTKCQGTGKNGSLNRGFVISRFVFHLFYCDLNSLGWKISFVIPRTSLYRGLLNRGSTVLYFLAVISSFYNLFVFALSYKNQQREFTLRQAKEMEKDAKQRLAIQRQEYEAAIQRHLSFIDQLIDDKKVLSERCEEVVNKLKSTDKKYGDKIKQMEDKWVRFTWCKLHHRAVLTVCRNEWSVWFSFEFAELWINWFTKIENELYPINSRGALENRLEK